MVATIAATLATKISNPPCDKCIVAAMPIIVAMPPGPNIIGMAKGMKATPLLPPAEMIVPDGDGANS